MSVWDQVIACVAPGSHAGLGVRLAAELAAARARWPEAGVTDDTFAVALVTGLRAQKDADTALARLRVEDLFLAQWCTTGDTRAIAAFEQVHRVDLDAVLGRFRRLAMTSDELQQMLRVKLFVGSEDRAPRIGDYSGFGFLQNWVRVTAARALVDIARREHAHKVEVLMADHDLFDVAALGADLTNRYSREQVGRAIKQAFAHAVAGLAPRQRNFLRHAHVDTLSLDQIAALYGIHRATVARTLAQARLDLSAATRKALGAQLGVSEASIDSLVRDADSRIDLSLSRVLDPKLAAGTDEDA